LIRLTINLPTTTAKSVENAPSRKWAGQIFSSTRPPQRNRKQ
jgi:hypothetical protein